MTNKNSQLGRSSPRERLTKEEIAALDKATAPAAPAAPTPKPPPAKASAKPPDNPPVNTNVPKQKGLRRDQLNIRWTAECPECGFKVAGDGTPTSGQRLARCGRCKTVMFLEGK